MYKIRPLIIFSTVIILALLYYFFSFLIPFTDNGFSMGNITPVAADVSGYITGIYVRNEDEVKKGSPLIKVFRKPYKLEYETLQEKLKSAQSDLLTSEQTLARDSSTLKEMVAQTNKANLNYTRNKQALTFGAVSEVDVKDMFYDLQISQAKQVSQQHQIAIDKQNIITQKHIISGLKYELAKAKVNLDETIIYAPNDGIVSNLYLSLGTPIEIHKPLFSFIDTKQMFIQANFSELDLRKVETGDKVYIIPRMYFGSKIYHGIVISKNWATNRQITNNRYQLQQITNNESNWIVFPQRFPVQIKLTDYDPKNYPLPIGSSCYVIIKI